MKQTIGLASTFSSFEVIDFQRFGESRSGIDALGKGSDHEKIDGGKGRETRELLRQLNKVGLQELRSKELKDGEADAEENLDAIEEKNVQDAKSQIQIFGVEKEGAKPLRQVEFGCYALSF